MTQETIARWTSWSRSTFLAAQKKRSTFTVDAVGAECVHLTKFRDLPDVLDVDLSKHADKIFHATIRFGETEIMAMKRWGLRVHSLDKMLAAIKPRQNTSTKLHQSGFALLLHNEFIVLNKPNKILPHFRSAASLKCP